jgi:DNA polymerase III sliding clamp (beta) subunit (PCNA family)
MIINTKDFQEAANKILLAADASANLELIVRESTLYLNVTNREYYVSIKFPLDGPTDFHAVVDASLFLSLISGITTETFDISVNASHIVVKAGKSSYKLAMIFENEKLMQLPTITIENKTVEMQISNDILSSILNINSKELLKLKGAAVVNELQKLYYIDETGCFTFTTGACLNAFNLEKPVRLLLNDRIVKLFKLFKEDVHFTLGVDLAASGMQSFTKISLETADTYLAALVNCDNELISKIQGPCTATKRYIAEAYDYRLVLSANELYGAISRLQSFNKNNKSAMEPAATQPIDVTISGTDFIIKDRFENVEVVAIENGSYVSGTYDFSVNLVDLKLVTDTCRTEHITFNCGNGRSIVINRGPVSNLIPERRDRRA